jgi:hypothetical protein
MHITVPGDEMEHRMHQYTQGLPTGKRGAVRWRGDVIIGGPQSLADVYTVAPDGTGS